LQKTGSFRIKDTARDVDVGYGITVEQDFAALKIEEEGNYGDAGRQPGQEADLGNPRGDGGRVSCLCFRFPGHVRLGKECFTSEGLRKWRELPQRLKPKDIFGACGTAEAVPFPTELSTTKALRNPGLAQSLDCPTHGIRSADYSR
jgi:hypothetical protein